MKMEGLLTPILQVSTRKADTCEIYQTKLIALTGTVHKKLWAFQIRPRLFLWKNLMEKCRECSNCKEIKPLDEFYNDKNRKDGKTSRCKECVNKADRCRKYECICDNPKCGKTFTGKKKSIKYCPDCHSGQKKNKSRMLRNST